MPYYIRENISPEDEKITAEIYLAEKSEDRLATDEEVEAYAKSVETARRIKMVLSDISHLESLQLRPMREIQIAQLTGNTPMIEDVTILEMLEEQITALRAELSDLGYE